MSLKVSALHTGEACTPVYPSRRKDLLERPRLAHRACSSSVPGPPLELELYTPALNPLNPTRESFEEDPQNIGMSSAASVLVPRGRISVSHAQTDICNVQIAGLQRCEQRTIGGTAKATTACRRPSTLPQYSNARHSTLEGGSRNARLSSLCQWNLAERYTDRDTMKTVENCHWQQSAGTYVCRIVELSVHQQHDSKISDSLIHTDSELMASPSRLQIPAECTSVGYPKGDLMRWKSLLPSTRSALPHPMRRPEDMLVSRA
ncbi:hypothetical protein BV25DRAFT_1843600 [Artomyces pyxidatus]|uniref:Uncharacterized protein n=1 Tax=Artomyces pyxidatus TaxID=48021 RepID=A0ACB8SEV0_9AGAM|nr:hypothetical protein BV25DRAFT_1843600 [Artomyces pyxidatus]